MQFELCRASAGSTKSRRRIFVYKITGGKAKKKKSKPFSEGRSYPKSGSGAPKSQPSILDLLCSLDIEEVGHFGDDGSVGTAAESVLF